MSTSNCRIDRISWRVCLVTILICLTLTAPQFISKFPRSSSRWRYTSSCAQSLISWPPACFTTVSQCSTLVPNLISLRILQAVTCSYLKGQRERRIYGGVLAQNKRCVPMSDICSAQFDLTVPIFFLGLPSCSVSFYPRIIIQFQSPARLRRCLAPRTPL